MDSVNKEIKALFLDIIDNDYSPEDLKKLAKSLGKDKEGIIFDMLKNSDTPLPPEIRHFAHYMRHHNDYQMMHDMYDYQKQQGGDVGSFFGELVSGFLGLFNEDGEDDLRGLEEVSTLEEDGYQRVFDNLADNGRYDTICKMSFFNDEKKKINYDRLSNKIVSRLQEGFDDERKFDTDSRFAKFLEDPNVNFDINEDVPSGKILYDLVLKGNYDVASVLIRNKKIDVNFQDENGNNAVLLAIDRRDDPEAAKFCRNLLKRDDLDRTLQNKQGLKVEDAINVFEGKKKENEKQENAENKERADEEEMDM